MNSCSDCTSNYATGFLTLQDDPNRDQIRKILDFIRYKVT